MGVAGQKRLKWGKKMGLRLSLKPNEKLVINGCVISNANRRQMLTIENHADVIREADLLDPDEAATPVSQAYFFIQSALLDPGIRDDIVPIVQKRLGQLAAVFEDQISGLVFEAANHVSRGDYYKALSKLRGVLKHEAELIKRINNTE